MLSLSFLIQMILLYLRSKCRQRAVPGVEIIQVIHSLSGRLAALHYFRDTIQKTTKQDILWPVWCGKFELQAAKGHVSPSTVISTAVWYPSLIRRCKRAFSNQYCAHTMLHGFDLMGHFEQGFSFLLATVTGMLSKDVQELSEIDGRRLNRSGGQESTDAFYSMAVVHPKCARELLHQLMTFPAGVFDLDDHPFARVNRMPLAQHERVVEQEGNGQLYCCLWEDSLEDGGRADASITCDEFMDLTVKLLSTQKSIHLLSSLPQYWHAGEWKEPPTMLCCRVRACRRMEGAANNAVVPQLEQLHSLHTFHVYVWSHFKTVKRFWLVCFGMHVASFIAIETSFDDMQLDIFLDLVCVLLTMSIQYL